MAITAASSLVEFPMSKLGNNCVEAFSPNIRLSIAGAILHPQPEPWEKAVNLMGSMGWSIQVIDMI
jgi:hypothetical protein